MATTTFTTMIPTPSKNAVAKRQGPPVPPRPHQSSLLRTQRDAAASQRSSLSKVGLEQPQILRKPTLTNANSTSNTTTSTTVPGGGRTIIYKSPSLNLQKRQEEREKRGESQSTSATTAATKTNAVTQTTSRLIGGMPAPKPPLKLRKAPDVPKPRIQPSTDAEGTASNNSDGGNNTTTNSSISNANNNNNIVIVQSSQSVVTLNRHHSLSTPSQAKPLPTPKDVRLSLGRGDFERVGKMNLNQLQPTSQPLPRPRKIVKIPVATLDMDDTNSNCTTSSASSSTTASHNTTMLGVNLFKRSKTTLDNFTSRSHITTVTTGHTTGSFLSGKTVEIKNNLKNAAERLFSEIMVNQQKHGNGTESMITKHERAIQHQTDMETGTRKDVHSQMSPPQLPPLPPPQQHHNVTVVNTNNEDSALQYNTNCTRINIPATATLDTKPPTPPTHANNPKVPQSNVATRQVVSAFNSPEKKSAAFHEMLISELAAMRTRSCSLENLQTKSRQPQIEPPPRQEQIQFNAATETSIPPKAPKNKPTNTKHDKQPNPDDDIDADNIEDADGDDGDENDIEHALKKSLQVISASAQNSPRKRTPSGCSSDSSPYGTERSSRIRTSDWIEVGDNGKQVTLTSCHISLEDSGLEDEERMDEMSSSGVGDSWDSVKEAEQQQQQQLQQQAKRNRSIKRIMSINDLPPLPKSLSGINKMLTSDSGLISDVDTEMAKNTKNNEFKPMESQKENSNNSSSYSISDTTNNNNNNGDTLVSPAIITATATSATSATPLKEINGNETISEIPPAIPGSKLDNQIATLRKEMFGLRQLDLSLLSQLWALNDSIQEFRTMIQDNDLEDDETFSTHSRSPSPYDSVSSDADDEISALKGKKKLDSPNANVITTQPKLNKSSYSPEKESNQFACEPTSSHTAHFLEQKSHLIKPALPKALDVKPVPRMRSAPPPPPMHRKSQNAPPRPT